MPGLVVPEADVSREAYNDASEAMPPGAVGVEVGKDGVPIFKNERGEEIEMTDE